MGKKKKNSVVKGNGESKGQLTLAEFSPLTAGPEPLPRAAVRPGLRAGVTGAAGRTGASTAAVIRRPGNQPLHPLPEQPWFRQAVDTRGHRGHR